MSDSDSVSSADSGSSSGSGSSEASTVSETSTSPQAIASPAALAQFQACGDRMNTIRNSARGFVLAAVQMPAPRHQPDVGFMPSPSQAGAASLTGSRRGLNSSGRRRQRERRRQSPDRRRDHGGARSPSLGAAAAAASTGQPLTPRARERLVTEAIARLLAHSSDDEGARPARRSTRKRRLGSRR